MVTQKVSSHLCEVFYTGKWWLDINFKFYRRILWNSTSYICVKSTLTEHDLPPCTVRLPDFLLEIRGQLSASQYVPVAMRGETLKASWTFSHKKTMVEVIPIIGHGGLRGCGCKGAHIYVYNATALGKVGWLVLCSATFTRGTHFIVDWVDPRSSLDTKDWRKFPPLQHSGSNPGRRAHSQAPCRLNHMTP